MSKKQIITTDLVVQNPETVPDFSIVASKLKRVSDETRKTYKYAMNSFKNYCVKTKKSQDLDSLIEWLESVQSPSTQSTHIAAVKKVFGEIFKHDPRLIELKESLDNIRPVKQNVKVTESKYLKRKEIEKIIKKSPQNISLIIETLFWTGLRISGLLNLEISNCEKIKGKAYYEARVVEKGRKEAVVYISEDLFKRVNKFFKGKKYLFEHEGSQYSREHITREISKYAEKAGFKLAAHKIRHSYACYLRDERKLPLDKISKAMNHSNISTTGNFYQHDRPTAEEIGII